MRNGNVSRSLLHVAADWPGHFPNCAATVATLVQAGAEVNARIAGPHVETPLHWAASSDDIEMLDALLDAGADIEASGAVIAGGTPLDDAVAFGQWRAAHRLVERGASFALWHAAAYLLNRGAELNWISVWDGLTPLDAAQRSTAGDLVKWLHSQSAKSAKELHR